MANLTELAVAIFGVAPGGFTGVCTSYYDTNGEIAYSDWLVSLLHSVYGSQVSTNSGLAGFVTANLVGANATSANRQYVSNYILTGLNAGTDAGTVIDNAVNMIDSSLATDPNWGTAHAVFGNKMSVAEFYGQTGGNSENLTYLTGMLGGVDSTASSVASQIDALSTAGNPNIDVYAESPRPYTVNTLNLYSTITHSSAVHDNIWADNATTIANGTTNYGLFAGSSSNAFDESTYYYLATGSNVTVGSELQLTDGRLCIVDHTDGYYYSPGATTYSQVKITTGNSLDYFIGGATLGNNDIVLYGQEGTTTGSSLDGYLVATDGSGTVLSETRIDDPSSSTARVSIGDAWAIGGSSLLVQINHTVSSHLTYDYALLDSGMQIQKFFTLGSGSSINSLVQNADGTYIALTSTGQLDYLDANFNLTATAELKLAGATSAETIQGLAAGNGSLFILAQDGNLNEAIMKLGGTGVGATISSAFVITSQGGNVAPASLTYDNGLLYAQSAGSFSQSLLAFNPDHGATASSNGYYRIASESASGSLVAGQADSTTVTTGSGVFQTHADIHLVGVATGVASTLSNPGIITSGGMGSIT